MNKRKIINDPVYGFITIPTDLIYDLIEHRYFQRLRRIKQLGLTHYVYPGALHTRFQHALGAMHLMGQAIQTLRSKGHVITTEEEEAARIAILLHDIGHGPYSHALEQLLLPFPHEEITLHFMRRLNVEFGDRLAMAISIFDRSYPKRFLSQLISGQLDMDRIDYLKRDSFYTGVAEGVIGHDRIIAMLNVVGEEIVVEEKALFSIEKFLVARRIMYLQVYLHKAVISAEQMVRKAITRLRDGTSSDIAASPALQQLLDRYGEADLRLDETALETFAQVDDVDVDYSLKQLEHSDDTLLHLLASGLIRRRLFRTVFAHEPFDREVIDKTIGQVSKIYGLAESVAEELVITGLETVPTYDPQQGEIRILMKDGAMIPLPELLEDPVQSRRHDRYYLCYPVKGV